MSRGIRKADPKIKIVTATTQPGAGDKYAKSLEQTFASPRVLPLYDVINLHVYATKPAAEGQSPWDRSCPEDPNIEYLKVIDDAIAFRDEKAPGKEVWVTEFGYDACTPEAMSRREGWAEKLNWQGVRDTQQAQYLVRSFLCFAERDVSRAYIYFFDDNDKASVHAASGLTRRFVPKPSFWAVKHLYETLGDYRMSRVVRKEAGGVYVYEFKHGDQADRVVWVVWSPTGSNRPTTLRDLPGRLIRAERMPLAGDGPRPIALKDFDGAVELAVTQSPVYLVFDGGEESKQTGFGD